MKTTVITSFVGTALVLATILFMTAHDRAAQDQAEAAMKARIFTKYPDQAIAQLALPLDGCN